MRAVCRQVLIGVGGAGEHWSEERITLQLRRPMTPAEASGIADPRKELMREGGT